MKKILFVTLMILVLSTSSVLGQVLTNVNLVGESVVSVNKSSSNGRAVRVLVEKDQVRYQYNLNENEIRIPLQMGSGVYQISILENVEGNRFRVISRDKLNVNIKDGNSVFLESTQMVNWNTSMEAIKKAQELVKGLNNDEQKVTAIYNYIINNFTYDFDKVGNLTSNYLPDIDKIFKSNKGICYDYSALFAAMLRSVGVPTKLVMGHAPDVEEYHAWNEVYINGQWFTIDTTVDAQFRQNNRRTKMFRDSSLYKVMREY